MGRGRPKGSKNKPKNIVDEARKEAKSQVNKHRGSKASEFFDDTDDRTTVLQDEPLPTLERIKDILSRANLSKIQEGVSPILELGRELGDIDKFRSMLALPGRKLKVRVVEGNGVALLIQNKREKNPRRYV